MRSDYSYVCIRTPLLEKVVKAYIKGPILVAIELKR